MMNRRVKYMVHLFLIFLSTTTGRASEENDAIDVSFSVGKSLGEECQFDEECHSSSENFTCSNNTCVCKSGYTRRINKCINETQDTKQDNKNVNAHVLPLMIGLGLMFVGMCVALNLFSRARFRNSRSIFNSPHPRLVNINLGDKRKRKRRHRRHSRASFSRRVVSPSTSLKNSPHKFTAVPTSEQGDSSVIRIQAEEGMNTGRPINL